MIEIETLAIRLGERDFTVKTAGFLRSKAWRARLTAEIQPMLEQVGNAGNISIESPADLLKLMPLVQGVLSDGINKICDLLIGYSADLEAERAYIEANATGKQILGAFQGVVKLEDPFGITDLMAIRFGLAAIGPLSS